MKRKKRLSEVTADEAFSKFFVEILSAVVLNFICPYKSGVKTFTAATYSLKIYTF